MTEKSLTKKNKDELSQELEARSMMSEGMTKQQMVEAIINYDTAQYEKQLTGISMIEEESNMEVFKDRSEGRSTDTVRGLIRKELEKDSTSSAKSNKSVSKTAEWRIQEMKIQLELEKLRISMSVEERKTQAEERKAQMEERKAQAEAVEIERRYKLQQIEVERRFEAQEMERNMNAVEAERRFKMQEAEREREHQLDLKKLELENIKARKNNGLEEHSHENSNDFRKLPAQGASENVLEFFTLFEKTGELHNIPKQKWHLIIGGKFNENTRQDYRLRTCNLMTK